MSDEMPDLTTALIMSLMDHHVPSLSPEMGIKLVEVRGAVQAIPDPSPLVAAYISALDFVATVACLHQAAVIATLEALVKKGGAGAET